jgi:hypothetical protein
VVNEKDGTSIFVPILNSWLFHPSDPTADVAINVFPFLGEERRVDVRCPDTKAVLTPEMIEVNDIGIGDEVFMPGLFTFAPGRSRNLPIVRHGNIAMMPTEAIQVDDGFAEVYLVEARSIGGLSGSPVYARRTLYGPLVKSPDGVEDQLSGDGRFYLLGLIHGHWEVRASDLNKTKPVIDPKDGVNMGIATVVPGYKILETLSDPKLVQLLASLDAKYRSSISPTPDTPK